MTRAISYKRFIALSVAALTLIGLLTISDAFANEGDIEVKGVEVKGLYSIGEEELLYLLGIETGGTLNRAELRRGIKRAFKKDIFRDISVETSEKDSGSLIVRVAERDFIKSIRVDGAGNIRPKFIKEQLGLTPREPIRYERLDEYRSKVLEVLRQKGYHDATVSIEVLKTRRPHRIKLAIQIDEGRPVYVREINIIGRPSDEVLEHMKVKANSVYDQFRLREDIEELTRYYRKQGYLNPVVGPFTFSEGILHFNVTPGQKLVLRIKGNDSMSKKKLTRQLPFYDAGEIRDDLIDEAVARMISAYHAKGYPNAQIAAVMSTENDEVAITFFVYEGPKVKVAQINLEGVTIDEESLKKVMLIREGALYNPDLLGDNAQVIRDFYNSLGYVDAAVLDSKVTVEDSGAIVRFEIKEGLRIVIKETRVEGVLSVPAEEVSAVIGLEAGSPYNEVDISDARRAIASLYREHGFLRAEVIVDRDFDITGGAYVTFRVTEGEKIYFGKTLIKGNRKTKLRVISRELQYDSGEPLNKTELLNARQRIYKTGLFSDVNIDILDEYGNKGDVVVDLKEGKAGTVEFGFGYGEYDRFRGFFDVSYKNLFGLNRSGSFRTELSSLMRRYILRYGEPWFLGRKMPFRAYLITEDRKEINIDTGEIKYKVDRYTAGIGIEKQLSEKVTFDLLYEYSFTETTDVISDIILSREDTGTLGISSITPSLSYDTRDNPFDPKKGLFAGISLKTATVLLLSETDFFKLVAFGNIYKQLTKRIVLAASARGGIAQGMRDTRDLPLVERFFLGGRSTVRGFAQDDLGPKGARGTPIGGNVFLLGNLEFRISITKSWRIVPFFDTGAVWLDKYHVDPTDLRYTAGLGLQYNTPVGPIRLDYGRKIDRRAGESSGEFHFSIGHAF
jgi:outer membrane protein insertion porin family